MKKTKAVQGSCLCGKIKVEAQEMHQNLGACHCVTCRKWVAGPFLTVDCGLNVKITGEENLGIFDSSEWADRGFCKNCGTSLFYRFKQNQHYIFSSEIFDEPELVFDHQVFIDHKPSYYAFSNKTKDMTAQEVFEAFAPKE